MPKGLAKLCGVFLGMSACAQPIAGHANAAVSPSDQESLRRVLQHFAHDPNDDDKSAMFSAASVPGSDLVLVYLSGNVWCGSGGCRLLVLQRGKGSFRIVSETSIVRRPITILKTRHHDLPDIGVWVQGGGIEPGYRAALPFDGKRYPSNPSIAPARKVADHAGRPVLADGDPGVPLFD